MNKKTLRSVLKYLSKYKFHIILSLILAAVSVGFSLYIPILIGKAIDLIVGPGNVDFRSIAALLWKVLAAIGITALSQWLMNTVNHKISFEMVKDIRNDAFSRLQKLPFSYLDSNKAGDTVSRIITDADALGDGILMSSTQLFTGIITILGTLVFLLTINVGIAVIVVLLTPMSLLLARFIAKRTHEMFLMQSKTAGEQTALIDEAVTNAKLSKAFLYEDSLLTQFDEINERFKGFSLKAIFYSSLVNPSTRLINSLIYASIALVGALSAIGGGITVGALTAALSYSNQYAKPFNEISGVIAELQHAFASAERLFGILEEKTEEEPTNVKKDMTVRGNIEIKNVSFSYSPDRKLIQNFNLSVKEGQRIAIVGPTGCGKTTLINLLMRFYDVTDGSILLDGVDIRNIERKTLRRNFGMVLQDTFLKSGTIKENIAFGKPDATDEEIISAAKRAHADSFIRRLPEGYDTLLGEDGGILSAGQKQLLSIARIMLISPPMLILDEATSSIDTRTEMKIQSAFKALMTGRTSFIVAHRLSTIKDADMIIVMKNGNVIETGTHSELLKKGGFYSELWNSQFRKR